MVSLLDNTECKVQVTVGNVLYCWDKVRVKGTGAARTYSVFIESRPKINNRRKYPRVDIDNSCTVTIKDTGRSIECKLDNISANGFAFITRDACFMDHKLEEISIEIHDFETGIDTKEGEDRYLVSFRNPRTQEWGKFFTASVEMKGILDQISDIEDGFPFETVLKM